MTIEFNCPECGKLLKTADNKAGVRAKCPGCGGSITVPTQSTASEPQAGGGDDNFAEQEEQYGGEPQYGGPPQYGDPPAGQQYGSGPGAPPPYGQQYGSGHPPTQPAGHGAPPGSDYPQQGYGGYLKPHRGSMLLTFAILGWACCFIFSIVAWVMANGDLQEIKAGRMDPSGEGLTNASRIVAMVHVIFFCAVMVLYCVFIMIMAASGELQ